MHPNSRGQLLGDTGDGQASLPFVFEDVGPYRIIGEAAQRAVRPEDLAAFTISEFHLQDEPRPMLYRQMSLAGYDEGV
jgi:hypothetical protein